MLYGNAKKSKITYIIGNTFNEANSFVGFDSSIISSTSPYAGYSIRNQNIILSCREDHLHEIVHAVFIPLFPKAPALFQEGIATYYGGTAGQSYSINLEQLDKMIRNNPDIDLSKINDLNNVLENGSNYFYTIGAIFIDIALKIGGPKKVLALFQDSVSDPSNWEDPLPAIKKEFGIKKDRLTHFLKNTFTILKTISPSRQMINMTQNNKRTITRTVGVINLSQFLRATLTISS